MKAEWIRHQIKMRKQGIRRLLIISGDMHWCFQRAEAFCQWLQGDWIWVGTSRLSSVPLISTKVVRKLLGQERLHAVFDATKGLDIDALAVLAGILKAGSWLLLLVPDWDSWRTMPDQDSLVWSEQKEPIATPYFIDHLQKIFLSDKEIAYWHQGASPQIPMAIKRQKWKAPTGGPTREQQDILKKLIGLKTGICVLTAARGRGKSALAGMLLAQSSGICWVTAPRKSATQILKNVTGKEITFLAPDALLHYCLKHKATQVDWLIIDEAATLPIALLSKLLGHFQRILLTTTVEGYEGTGRAFLLKLFSSLPEVRWYTLTQPVRWAEGDPLERVLNEILIFNKKSPDTQIRSPKKITSFTQSDWSSQPHWLKPFYGLLSDAHYRTSTRDLRRLMDAPGMHFSATLSSDASDHCVVAALWLVNEGGLQDGLARDIWAGRRRPPGSLVAQSLAAHSGQWWSPTLRSRRISRMVVMKKYRRQGIAKSMILFEKNRAQQEGVDFISVSFGYEHELHDFWVACGFKRVRIGSHKDTRTGCHTVMAILPLSPAGEHLCQAAQKQMKRDAPWLQASLPLVLEKTEDDQDLNQEDWRELAGFAFAHRTLSASEASLQRLLKRLLINSDVSLFIPLPDLRKYLQKKGSENESLQPLHFIGRKARLACWRKEVKQALYYLDQKQCIFWEAWVKNAQ